MAFGCSLALYHVDRPLPFPELWGIVLVASSKVKLIVKLNQPNFTIKITTNGSDEFTQHSQTLDGKYSSTNSSLPDGPSVLHPNCFLDDTRDP